MVLYVDETENEALFLVAGLLLDSKETADRTYGAFKKKARNMPVAKRDKAMLFTEFKSTILDRHYQRIKEKMICSLSKTDYRIYFACYIKEDRRFTQNHKEESYAALLSRIIMSTEEDVSIIFDGFNKASFEARIVDQMSTYQNVLDIVPRDSQLESGLQYIDNICSIIRMHKMNNDKNAFFKMIEDRVWEV